jgi:hypothetical protein
VTDQNFDSEVYILSWDMHGLEACVNASQLDRIRVWDTLANKETKHDDLSRIVSMMTMRARYNSQRHYEIYSIAVDSSITEDDLVEQFKTNPQYMADLVRDRGNKIYSDRLDEKRTLIR